MSDDSRTTATPTTRRWCPGGPPVPRTSSCSCSRRAPPAPPRPSGARKAAWPPSPCVSAGAYGFERDDVAYCTMPLFHGNALMVLWGPSMVVGATVALARRFSASGFVADVRRYGATTFTYVGKALAYVLATPPAPDDAAITLRRGFGTEASVADRAAFEQRFGCVLTEGYGSSEGGVAISRTPDTPPGALGPTDRRCGGGRPRHPAPSARRPSSTTTAGWSTAKRAVGEIVNRSGIGRFEGYYADQEATAARTRNGWYWTGDLAYRDEEGYLYFAGRRGDWMRVDSENLTAGPIERVLVRHEGVAAVAVYAVPDPRTGDQVMAALEMLPGRSFDPGRFSRFLDGPNPTWEPNGSLRSSGSAAASPRPPAGR